MFTVSNFAPYGNNADENNSPDQESLDWEYFYSTLDEMLNHCRVTLLRRLRLYPFIQLVGERQRDSEVSSPKTQHHVDGPLYPFCKTQSCKVMEPFQLRHQ